MGPSRVGPKGCFARMVTTRPYALPRVEHKCPLIGRKPVHRTGTRCFRQPHIELFSRTPAGHNSMLAVVARIAKADALAILIATVGAHRRRSNGGRRYVICCALTNFLFHKTNNDSHCQSDLRFFDCDALERSNASRLTSHAELRCDSSDIARAMLTSLVVMNFLLYSSQRNRR